MQEIKFIKFMLPRMQESRKHELGWKFVQSCNILLLAATVRKVMSIMHHARVISWTLQTRTHNAGNYRIVMQVSENTEISIYVNLNIKLTIIFEIPYTCQSLLFESQWKWKDFKLLGLTIFLATETESRVINRIDAIPAWEFLFRNN